jgi:hypothetical protein
LAGDTENVATQPGVVAMLLWLGVLAGVPTVVAWHDARVSSAPGRAGSPFRSSSPPPAVEPFELVALDRDQARLFNAAIPFSTDPNPPARPFRFAGSAPALDRAVDCLAAAELYEAGDEPTGEKAVAQVVLNRLRHPAFPKTVCGVVFQGSERTTGCQFTFTCDGALARIPEQDSWDRARALAIKALKGAVFPKIGYATHYHTDWVVPYWSSSLDKVTAVDTHLFFRWAGWWGTPPAFRRTVDAAEPVITLLARLSPAHTTDGSSPVLAGPSGAAALASAPLRPFAVDAIGKTFGGARLVAVEPGEEGSNGFAVVLDRTLAADRYPALAETFCGGRHLCRILAWVDPSKPADRFPVDPTLLPTMAFSYIQDSHTGLQRALWNCKVYPRAAQQECMRDRESTAGAAPVITLYALPLPRTTPPDVKPPAFSLPAKPDKHVIVTPPETSPAVKP